MPQLRGLSCGHQQRMSHAQDSTEEASKVQSHVSTRYPNKIPAPTKRALGPSPVIPTKPSRGAWSTPFSFTDTTAPMVFSTLSSNVGDPPTATVELALWQSKIEARMASVETAIIEMKQMLGTLLSKLNG
ncbi:unnamed protein product [Ixodes hexagonus]